MKAKKGKMPAALAKYWRTRRRAKKASPKRHAHKRVRAKSISELMSMSPAQRDAHYKRYYESSKRRKNPSAHRGYKLGIATPSGRLYYSGGKFSSTLPAVIFPTSESVRAAAKMMHSKHKHLRRYAFLAVPC
jgi:hypothetical protein